MQFILNWASVLTEHGVGEVGLFNDAISYYDYVACMVDE
jgi:hypothetical protein